MQESTHDRQRAAAIPGVFSVADMVRLVSAGTATMLSFWGVMLAWERQWARVPTTRPKR